MTLIYDLDLVILRISLHIRNKLSGQASQKLQHYRQTDTETDATENNTTPHLHILLARATVILRIHHLHFLGAPLADANRGHLRSAARGDLAVPRSRTTRYSQRCFAVSGPTLWNSLPLSVRDPSLTLTQFCARLKTVLFCRAYETLA